MSAPVLFENADWSVRAVELGGEPWFIAVDVASSLGYRMASDLTRRLDEDEKGTHSMRTLGGDQEMTVISESGLYSAILGSKLDRAKVFKRWVTHEVIPAIRKTGSYSVAPVLPQSMPEALRQLASEIERNELLELERKVAAPKVAAYDTFLAANGSMSMESAAKSLGVGRNTLFRRLREERILIPASNLPYQQYMRYFEVTQGTHNRTSGPEIHRTVHVRPEGLDFIARRLGLTVRPQLELVSSG